MTNLMQAASALSDMDTMTNQKQTGFDKELTEIMVKYYRDYVSMMLAGYNVTEIPNQAEIEGYNNSS